MSERGFRLYGYRWVVLAATMLVNLAIQILWIAYAPITGPAARFFGVTDLQIGLLAMSFMAVFIPLSIPVAWAIDTYGFRPVVSLGAVLMGLFGVLRGLAGAHYGLVFASTLGIAVAQPCLLNAWTKVPAQWFGVEERATAVGLITLSSLLGIALGMALTPNLVLVMGIPGVQLLYGGLAAAAAVLFLILARERPATPPCPAGMEVRALMLDGLKHALKVKAFWQLLWVFFVGMALFNGISTWIENIIRPRGFSPEQAGTLGAFMLVGGVLGAVILPPFSDRQHRRRPYLLAGLVLAIPGVLGLAFGLSYVALLASA